MTTATENGTATNREAEAFVEAFTEGWANPVDADSFSDHFAPWFHHDVRMIQPSVPTLVGKHAFREEFARPLFELVPDLHGIVESWAASGDVVYIELRLEGAVGGRPFTMRTCDRIKLREGKVVERLAYLDATPLIKAVALSPRAWPRFLKSQLRNLRRPS
jgi:ketosteroid isomerase-like protein